MDIANPAALWWLALVLVVFLVRRRKVRQRLAVANLYLWRDLPRAQPLLFSLTRWRRHWLAVLQVAFMLAVIAAIAAPSITWEPSRVALVIDISASMAARDAGTTRIARAKTHAHQIVRALPARSVVRLVAAGPAPVDLGTYASVDPGLSRAIDDLTPTAGAAVLDAALRVAGGPPGENATRYVLTDAPLDALTARLVPAAQWIAVGRPADNSAIVTLDVRRLPTARTEAQVFAEVRHYGAEARTTEIEFSTDGQVLASVPLQLDPDDVRTVVVDVPNVAGIVRARLRGDDALPVDDERYAVVPSGAPVKVLVVAPASVFLEKALASNPDVTLHVSTAAAPGLPDTSDYDVVVCDRCPQVPEGPGVLMTRSAEQTQGPRVPLVLATVDHPVARALDPGDGLVAPIVTTEPGAGAAVIVRAGDAAAVVADERQGRRVVELRIDLASSDFPLMTAFPVLVANAIDWLAARDLRPTMLPAGQPLHWTVRGEALPESLGITGPDGLALAVQVTGRHLTVVDTSVAGVYRVRGPGWDDAFVVNPVTEGESDLRSVAPPEVSSPAFTAGDARTMTPLTTLLVLGGLVCLLLEWWYRCRWAPEAGR